MTNVKNKYSLISFMKKRKIINLSLPIKIGMIFNKHKSRQSKTNNNF